MVDSSAGLLCAFYLEYLHKNLTYSAIKIAASRQSPIKLALDESLLGSSFKLHIPLLLRILSTALTLVKTIAKSFKWMTTYKLAVSSASPFMNFILSGNRFRESFKLLTVGLNQRCCLKKQVYQLHNYSAKRWQRKRRKS